MKRSSFKTLNIIHVPEKPTGVGIYYSYYTAEETLGSERLPQVVQLLSWQGQIQTESPQLFRPYSSHSPQG